MAVRGLFMPKMDYLAEKSPAFKPKIYRVQAVQYACILPRRAPHRWPETPIMDAQPPTPQPRGATPRYIMECVHTPNGIFIETASISAGLL